MPTAGALGKAYRGGEVIIRQGDPGDCMFVIQKGRVEVLQERDDQEVRLQILDEGDFFGEMAIFERVVRSATVRALEEVRVLTVDKRNFLRRIEEDPSLAFRIVQTLSRRLRKLSGDVTDLTLGHVEEAVQVTLNLNAEQLQSLSEQLGLPGFVD